MVLLSAKKPSKGLKKALESIPVDLPSPYRSSKPFQALTDLPSPYRSSKPLQIFQALTDLPSPYRSSKPL